MKNTITAILLLSAISMLQLSSLGIYNEPISPLFYLQIKTESQKALARSFKSYIVNGDVAERVGFEALVEQCCNDDTLLQTLALLTIRENAKKNMTDDFFDVEALVAQQEGASKFHEILTSSGLTEKEKIIELCKFLARKKICVCFYQESDLEVLERFLKYCGLSKKSILDEDADDRDELITTLGLPILERGFSLELRTKGRHFRNPYVIRK